MKPDACFCPSNPSATMPSLPPSLLPSLLCFSHLVGDVVDHDDAVRPSVVRRGDGAETLLPRRVPL